MIRATNIPENEQAWTIAAGLAAKSRVGARHSDPVPAPGDLERNLLDHAGRTPLLRTVAEVVQARNTGYIIEVQTRSGCELEREWVEAHARDVG